MAVVIVGALMMVYVLFGGMTATTWVQIIKACLLFAGATFMAVMVLAKFGFSPEAMFAKAVEIKTMLASQDAKVIEEAAAKGLKPAIWPRPRVCRSWVRVPSWDPISAISFGMALMFGTAGLPHILMRFFTVPDAKEARKSVLWATTWIGYFYVLTFIIGFRCHLFVLTNPEFLEGVGKLRGGGNMAAIHLASAVGGNVFLGFISAVAFATILAVVAGPHPVGASARFARPLRHGLQEGQASSEDELKVSRMTTIALGVIAVVLGSRSKSRTSPSWCRWPSRSPPQPTSRCCSCRFCGRIAPPWRGHGRLPRPHHRGRADRPVEVGLGGCAAHG